LDIRTECKTIECRPTDREAMYVRDQSTYTEDHSFTIPREAMYVRDQSTYTEDHSFTIPKEAMYT